MKNAAFQNYTNLSRYFKYPQKIKNKLEPEQLNNILNFIIAKKLPLKLKISK